MNFFKSEKKGHEDDDSDSEVQMNEGDYSLNDILICATHGKIYAVHKRNGNRLWRSKFPAMGGILSLFVTDYDKLIVGGNGKTACLNVKTGETIWINKMQGFGLEEVSVISTPSKFLSPKRHPIASSSQNYDMPPEYHDDGLNEKPIVFGSSRGKIMAIDSDTGEQIWRYNCPGGWYNIPVAIVEPPSFEEGRPEQLIYVGSGKWVYCLKSKTGDVVWSTRVSNAKFGLSYMTLATPWSSRLAAEAYSAFSQNPSAQARDWEREQEKRRSS